MPGTNYNASIGWGYSTQRNTSSSAPKSGSPTLATESNKPPGSSGSLSGMMGDRVNGRTAPAARTESGSLPSDLPNEEQLNTWRNNRGYSDSDSDSQPSYDTPTTTEGHEQEMEELEKFKQRQREIDEAESRRIEEERRRAEEEANSYVVQSGDSLWKIAKKRLGADASPQQIADYVMQLARQNGIKDPNCIYPGQRIKY